MVVTTEEVRKKKIEEEEITKANYYMIFNSINYC